METVSPEENNSGANPSSVKSDDGSPQPGSGRNSPPPVCAICLETCQNKSFTDSCLHQFCFNCLLTWSKVKAECPLCKQTFRSIIHNVQSNHQYEEYMVEQRQADDYVDIDNININVSNTHRRFRYRTTLTLTRPVQEFLIQQLSSASIAPQMVSPRPPPPPFAHSHRDPVMFRRTIYRHNLWARPLPDFTGRFRDCSPMFYSLNPAQMHRLVPWLNRELYYLLNGNVPRVSYVLSRILELLPRISLESAQFREMIHGYLGDRSEHFLHELYCFASTPYDLPGYDRNVQYTTNMQPSVVNEVISSSESDSSVDSDIVVVGTPRIERSGSPISLQGPSRVPPIYPSNSIPNTSSVNNVISIESISQSDTDEDNDDVMVIGYIKPPQDRTPEVVDLLGSDSDVIVQETSNIEPPPSSTLETPQTVERQANLVKVSLKRHSVPFGDSDNSDSDDKFFEPVRSIKIRRRMNSNDTATTIDTHRATPSPLSDPTWSTNSVTPIYSSSDFSSSVSSDADDTPVRKQHKKKKSKKKSRTSSKSRNKSSHKTISPERNKRSKQKSRSGKGVKSSKRPEPVKSEGASTSYDINAPSTSGLSKDYQKARSKRKHKEKSRENRRLKSVVNLMKNIERNEANGESSNTAAHSSNSIQFETPSPDRRKRRRTASSTDESDSEDNLPLNLSVGKFSENL